MFVKAIDDVKTISYAEGVQKRVIIGPKEGAPNFVMRVFDVSPDHSSMYHTHNWEHEVLILSGEAILINAKEKEIQLRPMDAIFIPPNEKHCLKNTGKEILRFLCMVPISGEDTP